MFIVLNTTNKAGNTSTIFAVWNDNNLMLIEFSMLDIKVCNSYSTEVLKWTLTFVNLITGVRVLQVEVSVNNQQNGKECRSWRDGSSGYTLFADVYPGYFITTKHAFPRSRKKERRGVDSNRTNAIWASARPTIRSVWPAKTQNSLYIHPIW